MSNVVIKRAVENIRSGTNVYTPLIEVVVNGIQAVEEAGRSDGKVIISVNRSGQTEMDDSRPAITGFTVSDNGVGFTGDHRDAFDTLYTDHRIAQGGKGFGRLTCLKYYRDVHIDSVFQDIASGKSRRRFRMGRETELIVDEAVTGAPNGEFGTTVRLVGGKYEFPDRTTGSIARTLIERLLPFFITPDKPCPKILLQEEDGEDRIVLNDYLGGIENPLIVEVPEARDKFSLESSDGSESFLGRVFKLYSPSTKRSKVSLVAQRREVTTTSIHQFIPEFSEEFYDMLVVEGEPTDRNFVVAVYVFGDYLDEHVSTERGGFEFSRESDLLFGISQREIESRAAGLAEVALEGEVKQRRARKEERVRDYVRDQAPWHALVVKEADFTSVPYGASDEEIDAFLHRAKHSREVEARAAVHNLLKSEDQGEVEEKAAAIVQAISENSRSELVHYVALRRSVLDIFARSLETDEDDRYRSENMVHDVIFPRKGDTDTTPLENHQLWIIDERLNFMEYLSSDRPLVGEGDRPDLLGFGRRIGFRGENEPTNPVIIFEFKKPGRDDFVNPGSKEDPVEQTIRYVSQIRDGKHKNPVGREIRVAENTPFYGFVVCDLTPKVRRWATEQRDFRPMPDGLGLFRWHDSLNLYLEILSWDKVRDDANARNRIFFHKLGIE